MKLLIGRTLQNDIFLFCIFCIFCILCAFIYSRVILFPLPLKKIVHRRLQTCIKVLETFLQFFYFLSIQFSAFCTIVPLLYQLYIFSFSICPLYYLVRTVVHIIEFGSTEFCLFSKVNWTVLSKKKKNVSQLHKEDNLI